MAGEVVEIAPVIAAVLDRSSISSFSTIDPLHQRLLTNVRFRSQ
jgi:hypothetical protein